MRLSHFSFIVCTRRLIHDGFDSIGIIWDEKKYPWEEIGTIEFEPQDSWRHEFRNWWDDKITVNSWHGLKEHQPLGSTNRMRRVVVSKGSSSTAYNNSQADVFHGMLLKYAESRKLRLKVNGYKDYTEPVGIDDVPKGPISVAAA